MKMSINKPMPKSLKGEYSSVEELVNSKIKRANQTLKNVNLSILPKLT